MSNQQKLNEKATLLSRMGFKDKDLTKTTHDELCIWLSDDEIQKRILFSLYREKLLSIGLPYINEIKERISCLEKKIESCSDENYFPNLKVPEKWLKEWETEIIGSKQDLEHLKKQFEIYAYHQQGDWEYIIKTEKGFYIGFIDFHRRMIVDMPYYKGRFEFFYEIKVSKQPIGEILRQLNMYHDNIKTPDAGYTKYIVICQNDSWLLEYKNIIEDNGWHVITTSNLLDLELEKYYNRYFGKKNGNK